MWLGWIKSEINIRGMVSDEIDRNDLDVSREQKKKWRYSRETEWWNNIEENQGTVKSKEKWSEDFLEKIWERVRCRWGNG